MLELAKNLICSEFEDPGLHKPIFNATIPDKGNGYFSVWSSLGIPITSVQTGRQRCCTMAINIPKIDQIETFDHNIS